MGKYGPTSRDGTTLPKASGLKVVGGCCKQVSSRLSKLTTIAHKHLKVGVNKVIGGPPHVKVKIMNKHFMDPKVKAVIADSKVKDCSDKMMSY